MKATTSQVYGIRELYRPTDEPAEIDIVAVHGLNGDSIKTWTSESEGICWLNHPDFLPKYVNRARVLTWGYNANVSSLNGKTTSSDRILQHAQTLVAQLHADRELEGAQDRPIIFLCHSLGGIIVKRALAYSASRSAPKIRHLQSVYTCTYAILFFGTPHNGSNKARLLSSLQKLATLAIPKTAMQFESSLLKALEQESETLQNITDQFAPLMCNFCIFFFWEQEQTDLKYTKECIVDEASAAPILDDTERSGIAGDHRGMCRFEKNTSQDFRTVVAALRRYSQQAPEVIYGRLLDAGRLDRDRRGQEAMKLLRYGRPPMGGNLIDF
ncbi:Protein SERAC1 [Lachnellula subtilissima]|uniref:Protein SERAC1 n=1 Tax=Lachnellula subtilissima TaxID=602034 RepID=A0A8H8RSY9_9HELO|nr:Protein SERAC1 [Lachnellula subtilissima]